MNAHQTTLIGSLIASLLSLCGCGQTSPPPDSPAKGPTLIETIAVTGFDPEGEPTIKRWSDGSLWIHFEAMPPFFAERNGNEAEFEGFELKIQKALGVPVVRDDREVFVIKNPAADTLDKAKAWLEGFRKSRS